MANLNYTEFNWPKRQVLTFTLPALTEASLPFYFTGSTAALQFPDTSRDCFIRRIAVNGNYTAVGTGVILTFSVYKGSVDAANVGMTVDTVVTSTPGTFQRQQQSPSNAATGMNFITSTDGIVGEIALGAGDTFVTSSGAVLVEVEFV